ncbi:SufD family Fe-S cluster assembly protein [Candidatus Gottesmanbacteria bacterium]|nr:SufD family Fe-S cluster assembly protein [Candidatus Gottesmanbacteria bacterium]
MTPEFTLTRAKLLAKVKNPPLPVFKITTEDFREVEATANHPFLVLKKKGKISYFNWMPLDKIKVGDLIAVSGKLPWVGKNYPIHFNPKRGKKEFFYPEISSEELLWLLGFYIGDGCMDKTRVYIAVPQSDKSFKKVIETINKLFGLKPEIKRNIVRYASTKFVDFLVKLGFKGKAQDKEVPEWIYTLPKSQITSFIEGYIDADGYRRDNHRNISITSVNKKLLQQVKDLSYITDKFSPRKISLWTRRERKPLGIEEKVYKHHFLYFGDDKKDSTIQFVRVNSIVPQGSKETFDIEVDKGNFIANGILVHNSKLTMKYPSVYLMGKGARGEVLSVAYAGPGQHQDAGGKAIHFAPYTSSKITSKSVSHGGGRTSYRGLLQVFQSAIGAKSKVVCDALLIDDESRSDTYPTMDIKHNDCRIEHEATVSKIGDDQLFYLMSRGINKPDAEAMVVNGFIEPIVKQLPLEYAVELNRLIQLEMEGSVG